MDRPPITPSDRSLGRFLSAVHQDVLRLGVRDHVEIQRLVRSRPQWQLRELCDSLAAMLATNPEQLQQITRLFAQHMAEPARAARSSEGKKRAPRASDPAIVLRPAPLPPPLSRPQSPWGRLRVSPSQWSSRAGLAIVIAVLLLPIALLLLRRVIAATAASTAPMTSATPTASPSPSPPPPTPTLAHSIEPLARSPEAPRYRVVQRAPSEQRTYHRPSSLREPDADDALAFLLSWLVLFLGFRFWMAPAPIEAQLQIDRAARRESARRERRELARQSAAKGEPVRLSYSVPRHLPLRRAALDDAATLLARLFRRERNLDLDVDLTVRETVRRAGRLHPVFTPRRSLRDMVVLLDIERGDHPYRGGFELTLGILRRRGVSLIVYHYQHSPAWLFPEKGGPPSSLHDLSRRHADSPLLIFARALSPRALQGDALWLGELRAWAHKAWIDPDPRPLEERPARRPEIERLRSLGLKRFPWTEAGLLAVARHFASEGEPAPEPPWPALPSRQDPALKKALERWALCAALVPDASWDQLEAIRRHSSFPELHRVLRSAFFVQRLIDWVAENGGEEEAEGGDGRTLQISPELVDRLIRDGRRREGAMDPSLTLESRAHRLLLEQLAPERPERGLQRLRWELKMASHRIALEPKRIWERMECFLDGPVGEEALAILDAELKRQEAGLAPGGQSAGRATIERIKMGQGATDLMPLRALFWGNWRIFGRAAFAATAVVLAIGVLTFGELRMEWSAHALLDSGSADLQVLLPAVDEVSPAEAQGGASGQ